MKHPKNTIILIILFSIALFALGLFTFGNLFEFILPTIDGVFYQATEIGGQFRTSLLFSLVLGATPFIIYLTWQYSPILSKNKRIISVLTVIVCMTLTIIARQQILKEHFNGLIKNYTSTSEKLNISYPLNQINFEYYLLGGLIVGCFISFLLLRQKESK